MLSSWLYFRQKKFEKTEEYKKAFKGNEDGVISTQPGKRPVALYSQWETFATDF